MDNPIPILTICIPAFGFEKGVRRILDRLNDDPRLEVLIYEDASERPLDLSDLMGSLNFVHNVNPYPTGAVANWNRLQFDARGKFVWLLHHDEEPIFAAGLSRFIDQLAAPDAPSLFISHLDLKDRFWQRILRSDLVRWLLLKIPVLTLIHNYIGSPSNLVVNREQLEPFDEKLKWFVDVDWYYRLLNRCSAIDLSSFHIRSHPYSRSITSEMRGHIHPTANRELVAISEKYRISRYWRILWKSKIMLSSQVKRSLSI